MPHFIHALETYLLDTHKCSYTPELILGMGSTNQKRRDNVTSSLIARVLTQNDAMQHNSR